MPVQPQLNARVGLNYLDYSYSGATSSVDYDFKLKLTTVDALLDYYPTSSNFRLTGGLVYNGNKITANAKSNATGSYTLNNKIYDAASAGKIDGKIDFRKVAPYLGIGWGNAVAQDGGWGFTSDLGVMFQGSPDTSLTNSGCTALQAICTDLANSVAVENVSLADKASKFKAYPVLRVGLSYKF
ncbi:MAG: hypothetical protein HHJ12_13635 [Glaciimonas sp.]|nr:hypothetical protein [Glaciimonas sp.]